MTYLMLQIEFAAQLPFILLAPGWELSPAASPALLHMSLFVLTDWSESLLHNNNPSGMDAIPQLTTTHCLELEAPGPNAVEKWPLVQLDCFFDGFGGDGLCAAVLVQSRLWLQSLIITAPNEPEVKTKTKQASSVETPVVM